ncbi:anaphase-promoting complex subunit cdc27 [Saxophila tyrrhenica]|uniref:Anaphase-promoting complex subunit cdc27 n=1 Tax=Saxophila tyrrhenica TaxID=1690608 RepID=A0AAV9PDJ5_9PEZI|nr:anaphase-promoting complex subunit cdc27 [Saxophila tyrrhenica]
MASTTTASALLLTQQIQHHLDTDLLDTANFLAGRLHALEPRNPDSAHLLALTYIRLRRFKAAADSAQKFGSNGRHLGCAYTYAQACLQLGRNTEGAGAMEKSKALWTAKIPQRPRFLPDAAAGWTLLGKLWQAHGDSRKAGDCFVEAHKANPFTWEAFEGLCKVGADLNVQNMFRAAPEMAPPAASGSKGSDEIYMDELEPATQPLAQQLNFNQQVFTPSADPFGISARPIGFDLELGGKAKARQPAKPPLSEWDTPVTNSGSALGEAEDVAMSGMLADSEGVAAQPPRAPARRTRPGQQQFDASERPRQPTLRGHGVSASEGTEDSLPNAGQHQRKPSAAGGAHKRTVSGQQAHPADAVPGGQHPATRRSNRLFGQGTTATSNARSANPSRPAPPESNASVAGAGTRPAKAATGAKGRIGNTKEGEKEKRAPSRTLDRATAETKTSLQPSQPRPAPAAKQPAAPLPDYTTITSVLDTFRPLATATYSLSRSDTPTTLRTLRSLPTAQRETPFALALLAKAHYESADYKSSEETFAKLFKLQPTRTQDMEVYSTVLWHLKKDAQLAFLCHLLRDSDQNAPQTWVAAGNAFSLSREHDAAIGAFRRAVQVDSGFAYAWTLMGHEFIANEDFTSAVSAFRHAVSVDRRGYGGWYGLGKCAERVGNLEDAERHYRIASSLNPSNSTLLVCIGVILDRRHQARAALTLYTKALELSPSSALARFKRARVLMRLKEFHEARDELEVLREQAPEEANVWFLLGKCCRALNDRGEGLRCFTYALNLDGKAAPLIKEAMEAMDESEEEGEEGIDVGDGSDDG